MLRTTLRPLRQRDFALLWGAGVVSTIGTWMQIVAVGVLVTDLTGKAAWTAVAYTAGFVPRGLLAPVGGALADRLDRRRGLVVGNLADAGLAGLLAVAVAGGWASPAFITVVVFVSGSLGAFRMPFQQAMLPDLVPRHDLLAAVSLGWAQWNLGRVVGPVVAGVVIAAGSFSVVFAFNAVSFLAVVLALLVIRIPPRPPTPAEGPGRLVSQIRAGARAVAREPGCRTAILLVGAAALLVAPFMSLIPALAALLVGGGAEATAKAAGTLTTAQGVGALVSALALAPVAERLGRRRVLVGSLLLTPAMIVPYVLSPSIAVAACWLLLVGAAYTGILSTLGAVMQLRAPQEVRARAISLFHATLTIAFPLGSLVQGAIADRVGLRPVAIVAAGVLVAVVAGLRAFRPAVLDAVDDPPEPSVTAHGTVEPVV